MSKTVVGLFPSTSEAQNVKHELVNQGYSASNISVVAKGDSTGGTVPSGTSAAAYDNTEDTGIGARISQFFRSLTGADEETTHGYHEGVRQGGAMLSVVVPDGEEDKVADLLERHGARDLDTKHAAGGVANPAAGLATPAVAVSAGGSVPVVEETLQVGKRQVQRGGVRVYSHVVEEPVQESIKLREEHVQVNRQTVDRPASEADFNAFREGTIDLRETAEEAVVSKSARVVEEITVGKETSEHTQTIQDTLRHTEVQIEQLGTGAQTGAQTYDADFRKHFATNYGTGSKTYESYQPAYQYGSTLANDPRYTSSDWSTVESSARTDWASKGQGKWEDFKDAVHEGWNRVHNRATAATR